MSNYIDQIYLKNFCPENEALIFGDRRYTYKDLDEMIGKTARYLINRGVKKDDKILLICQNSPEFIFSYMGIIRAGATAIPLNITLTPEEIKYIVKDCSANFIMISEKIILEMVRKLKIDPQKEFGKEIVILDENFNNDILKKEPYAGEERAEICTFLYTSGTTGFPKGAMLTHKNLLANVISLQEVGQVTEEDNMLCVLPLFHSFAWTTSILLPFYAGGKVTLLESFSPKVVKVTFPTENVTLFCGAPPMYTVLLQVCEPEDLKTGRLFISGGSALPSKILHAFEEKFKQPLIEGYGLSEASPVVTLNPLTGGKPLSIGLPIPGVEVKVVDDSLKEVKRGEVGELAVKGDNVMKGYYNLPEETEKVLVDGWLLTGDMVREDEEGYFYIVDRKKELIVVSGFNVYPKEVESVILNYPGVAECAVVGASDDVRGEIVKAFIVLNEGAEITEKDIRNYLKEHLAPYKRPRIIEFVESLPKNAIGKVMKKLLK